MSQSLTEPDPELSEPEKSCRACPRLYEFREKNRTQYPDFFNGPVPPFGQISAEILVVGLAPGLKGANRTGRPFTGDGAGDLLYPTLIKSALAKGKYLTGLDANVNDGVELLNTRITNALRCVPPQNKVTAGETATCNGFLASEISAMSNLRVIIGLGTVAHGAVLTAVGLKKSAHKFTHGQMFDLGVKDIVLLDSYHCSRYNTNTGKLTPKMLEDVFLSAKAVIKGKSS